MHDQRMAIRVTAVVEAGEAGAFRSASHIERAFDRARGLVPDAKGLVDRRDALRIEQAAALLHLDREDVGPVDAGNFEGAFRAMQGFVRHEGNGKAAGEARERGSGGDRLLHQFAARIGESGHAVAGFGLGPGHVDIDPNRTAIAQGPLDGRDMGHILANGTRADLQLEDPVTAKVKHFLRLLDVAGRIAGSERPGDRQPVAPAAADQFADRQAEANPVGIEKSRFHGALRKAVVLHHFSDARHERLHPGGILTDHDRCEVAVDGELHAFGALATIGQTADRRPLANADGAVAAMDLDQHEGLPVHGGDGQLVRTDRRKVDQHGLDPFNDGSGRKRREGGCGVRVHDGMIAFAVAGRPTPFNFE